ncbi:hypothetical protein V2W45_1406828 [Cenococcum geophilum]
MPAVSFHFLHHSKCILSLQFSLRSSPPLQSQGLKLPGRQRLLSTPVSVMRKPPSWLRLWSTGGVSSKSDLTKILSPDIASYDETFGGPVIGISSSLASCFQSGDRPSQSGAY